MTIATNDLPASLTEMSIAAVRARHTQRIESEEQWHAMRDVHVGGSEVAALFGVSPYMSRYKLWHIKAGNLPPDDLSEDERVFWGTELEPAVANGVRRKLGWNVQKRRVYTMHKTLPGFGGSLDYQIVGHPKGPGVLEIKCIDWLVFKSWPEKLDDTGAPIGRFPPFHQLLQVYAYMALTGWRWGCLAVLVGGNQLHPFIVERDEEAERAIATIEREVEAFWGSIEAGTPPPPNGDCDAVKALYKAASITEPLDLCRDNSAPAAAARFHRLKRIEKRLKARMDQAAAELQEKLGKHERAIAGDHIVKWPNVAGRKGVLITADMVGTTINTSKPTRRFSVEEIRG